MTDTDQAAFQAARHQALIEEGVEMLDSPEAACVGHLMPGLKRYLVDRVPTGGFLRCVLENDLEGAIGHAHPTITMQQMKTLVMVLSSSFPAKAYGSAGKVEAWLKGDDN